MRKLSLIAVGLIACLVIGSASLAVAANKAQVKRVKSTISLAYTVANTKGPKGPYDPSNPSDPYNENVKKASFNGKVGSKKKFCRKGRTVKVKNITTKQIFGTAKTNKAGNYVVNAGKGAPAGTYRAKVKKKVKVRQNGNKLVCKRAKSGTVTVS